MMREPYYVDVRKGKHVVVYGPTDDEDMALVHALLLYGLDFVWERVRDNRRTWRRALRGLVTQYSDSEIVYLIEDPGENELASFTVRPLSAIRMHPSWRGRTWHGHPVRTRAEALAIASQFLD